MTQATDLLLFEELTRLPRYMRRAMMHQGQPGEQHPGCGRPMFHGHHGHPEGGSPMDRGYGPENRPEGPRHPFERSMHHGNRPFARERVMEVLLGFEDGARQKELAEALRVNPSSMSELIDKLQSEGYIERTIDPEDKRATRIVLTELGKARACEISDERAEKIRPLFANLTEDEKEELLRLIKKLSDKPAEE